MTSKHILSFILAFGIGVSAYAATPVGVTDRPTKDAVPVVNSDCIVNIVVDPADAEVVRAAADMFASDVNLITSKKPTVVTTPVAGTMPIITGTLGQSSHIDKMVKSGKIKAKDLAGKWETFLIKTVSNPLPGIKKAVVVAGSDPRGTAYGILELSRLAGVSPYVWWADVIPEPRPELYITGDYTLSKTPSVQYRGMFINDEDFGLEPWAASRIDRDRRNIGPRTYAKVAELLLRLRANTLWPAMHLCSEAFWANPANVRVAKKYDIVMGSSHCEQMLRDNEWEWRHMGLGEREWNWKTNKDQVTDYWARRVGESRGVDAIYTLGMRGVHDSGMNGYTRPERVEAMTDVIATQRRLIADSLGTPSDFPQIFIPYKEALEIYNDGLQLPEDVTICWVDDNHGYIRQLPDEKEQARSGGHGIYYHLSYLGEPVPWTWLSSLSPTLASYELSKAYENNVRRLWVINVGDIKPQEAEFEFCMDLAYDIDSYTPEKSYRYIRDWAARTFGEEHADEIAHIRRENYRLSASGKPEHVYRNPYSINEQNSRIADYEAIIAMTDSLRPFIPDRLQNAYFELVTYPIKAAGWMNKKVFRDQQGRIYAEAGMQDESRAAFEDAAIAYASILSLTDDYNRRNAGGKWNRMMTYQSWGHAEASKVPNDYSPYTAESVSPVNKGDEITVAGNDYAEKSDAIRVIEGLGTSDFAATVWPLNMTAYDSLTVESAPRIVYNVPVKAGKNRVDVRCLSTFPINRSYDLRVGVAHGEGAPEIISVKTVEWNPKWYKSSIAGYCPASVEIVSESDATVPVTVYLLDPGIVVNDIVSTPVK